MCNVYLVYIIVLVLWEGHRVMNSFNFDGGLLSSQVHLSTLLNKLP